MLYLIFDAYSCNRAQCSGEEDNPLQSVFTIQHQLDLQMRYKTNFGTFSETEIEHRRRYTFWENKTCHTLHTFLKMSLSVVQLVAYSHTQPVIG